MALSLHPNVIIREFLLGQTGYWLAMQGRTYHRIFPTLRTDHPTHWFLYDAAARDARVLARNIPHRISDAVRQDIEQYNPLLRHFRTFSRFRRDRDDVYLELADPGSDQDIAALLHIGDVPQPTSRAVYVQRRADAQPTRIPILHSLYEPLQYPVLYPHGSRGWGESMRHQWTQAQYYKARLLTEPRYQTFSRLGCEWVCDMFSRLEDERLQIVRNGKKAEASRFRQMHDAENDESDEEDSEEDPTFTLPASFTGSPKYYAEKVADALALARQMGKPDLMITATCNPNWPEIRSQLAPGQSAVEVPHITARVFKVPF